MQLGFCSQFTDEHINFASEVGFVMELEGSTQWSQLMQASPEEVDRREKLMKEKGVRVAGIIHTNNFLSPDASVAKAAKTEFYKLLDYCERFGADCLATATGRDDSLSLQDNIKKMVDVFGPMLKDASAKGVRIAFENCPSHNQLATTPANWELIFNAIDSPNFGLEIDPSHLVWQGVDYLAALSDFRHKIIRVHAKDTQIYQDKLAKTGFYGDGWWTYRLPGYGSVNWTKFFQILREMGYDGIINIEHEDPYFHGERHWEGLKITKRYLEQFVW